MNKKEFRQIAIKNRDNMLNIADKSHKIFRNLINLPEFINANIVASYQNIKSEVSTLEINDYILKLHKTLCLPKTRSNFLEFKVVENLERELEICGKYNILEPKDSLKTQNRFDLIIVPGVAFSKNLNRMGYGAGYFDKFLSDKNVFKIGVCFENQIYDCIPIDENDIEMDILVTENGIFK